MRYWALPLFFIAGTLASAQNLITNGDFESGDTGFSSDYTSTAGNWTEGQYTVTATPSSFNGFFHNGGDHTTGTGKMLVVNGATSGSPALWRQTLTVTTNTSYDFRGYVATAVAGGPAVLVLKVNGQTVGAGITAPYGVGQWYEWNETWDSGASTSAIVEIINSNLSTFPNDFYVDDLSLEAVPEPGTLSALALGGLALLRRRRQSKA